MRADVAKIYLRLDAELLAFPCHSLRASGILVAADAEKYNGIAEYAKSKDWLLRPVDARVNSPNFRQIIRYYSPAGIILDASCSPQTFANVDFGNIPVVIMNLESNMGKKAQSSVSSDSREIAKLAVSELLEANPSMFVFIEWFNPSMRWSSIKREVASELSALHGIPLRIITPTPSDMTNPSKLGKRISTMLKTLPRPCGVFAVSDIIGAAAVSAARRIGANIPEDISVISVDDDPEICESCSPTLSSVRPDFHQLGFSAASLLCEAMEHPNASPKRIEVAPLGIVRRASTRLTRIYDKKVHDALESIRLDACNGITPHDIAGKFGTSRRMAEIRFKAATGRSIGHEILEKRLSVACAYLKEGKTSIYAIANFCGWKSDLAFRKSFKAHFGISPREWRNRIRAS